MTHFNKDKALLIVPFLLFTVFIIFWSFPNHLGVTGEKYSVTQFRADLAGLAGIIYTVVTLYLVLLTRNMAEISRNMAEISLLAQKASNRPELFCELFISGEKPIAGSFNDVTNIEIRNTPDSKFNDAAPGASIFLVIRNRIRGGKAINLTYNINLVAQTPQTMRIERTIEVDYLAEGSCVAVHLYRLDEPEKATCHLKLNHRIYRYTTPFNDASKEPPMEYRNDENNPILASGNSLANITLGSGIITNA